LKADIRVGQKSALFSILSILYIPFLFHIFKKRAHNLSISIHVSFFSFVDNSLFVSQEKYYKNQMQFSTVVVVLFSLSSINSALQSSIKNQNFSTFQE